MSFLTDRKYSFVSGAWPSDTFAVVDFKGEERLSRCYRFEVMLVAENAEIDLGRVVQKSARFTIHREEGDDVDFHGILQSFEQLQEVDGYVFYRAVLSPRLWWLSLTHHNQVFLDRTVKEILDDVLKDGGLTALDYEFRLQGGYRKLAYVCQYGESHLNFISRWMDREGIYYFFEQTAAGEKVIITDTVIAHTDSSREGLAYKPSSGLGETHRLESCQGLVCRYSTLPQKIRLRDYNYRKPSLEITGSAVVDAKGRGEDYYYGEHFPTPEEGGRLAKIRAQELLCRKEEYFGESTVPYIRAGYTFRLQDHYRSGFNRRYLTVEMTHEGGQTGYLISEIMKGLSYREERVFYRNRFTAIPSGVQFRPRRSAERPRISGTLNAKIDAAGSGKYAELDDQGRYKVVLPFDLSGRKGGKASAWLRMVQPYAGSDHGMHLPLHKGTEVLLTFIEGNPDRPVIAGAVPNPANPSQVIGEDQTMAKITTSGGNKIHMEDQEGQQRILLLSPHAGSFVRLGAQNDPGVKAPDGITEQTLGSKTMLVGRRYYERIGDPDSETTPETPAVTQASDVYGDRSSDVRGNETETVRGRKIFEVGRNVTAGNDCLVPESGKAVLEIRVIGDQLVEVGTGEAPAGRTLRVTKNETVAVGGDRSLTVGAEGDMRQSREIVYGDRQEMITGKKTMAVGGTEVDSVGDNQREVTVHGNDYEKIRGQKILRADEGCMITSGNAARITVQRDGTVNIEAWHVNVKGTGSVVVDGGPKVEINSSASVTINGGTIALNC